MGRHRRTGLAGGCRVGGCIFRAVAERSPLRGYRLLCLLCRAVALPVGGAADTLISRSRAIHERDAVSRGDGGIDARGGPTRSGFEKEDHICPPRTRCFLGRPVSRAVACGARGVGPGGTSYNAWSRLRTTMSDGRPRGGPRLSKALRKPALDRLRRARAGDHKQVGSTELRASRRRGRRCGARSVRAEGLITGCTISGDGAYEWRSSLQGRAHQVPNSRRRAKRSYACGRVQGDPLQGRRGRPVRGAPAQLRG